MTIKEAFNFTKQELLKAGVESPAFDTICFFDYVFSFSRADITVHADRIVENSEFSRLQECIKRRALGEPVQYIIGKWYFMGNTFKVSEGVLIPRDDTEVVVCACLDLLKGKENLKILDLCSGSGIIAITLKKHFENSTVYAVEKSDIAYNFLCENAKLNETDINTLNSDLYDCVTSFPDNSLDLLVSNPPYIVSDEIKTLQKEVQFEPSLALDGGEDGYDFYRGIIKYYSKKLKYGGYIAFEIGEGQFEYIKNLLLRAGFKDIKSYLDLGNTIRAITAVYNS